jgi:phage recombination protein Bet
MNAVAKQQPNGVATASQYSYSPEQIDLIKRLVAPQATPDELALFLYVCKRTGLDPLTRQIYCIHRKSNNRDTGQRENKMTIQTSIDGFRVVAERTGKYAGQAEPEFEYDEGGNLLCAKVRVFKWGPNNERYESAVGVAFWPEYVQTDREGHPSGMWAKMQHTMLSKVSEAVALRKAFPQDLSGLYTAEEMAQADGQQNEPAAPANTDSVETLHKEYIGLLGEYSELVGDGPASQYFPENWDAKVKRNAANYTYAIQSISSRIAEEKSKQAQS